MVTEGQADLPSVAVGVLDTDDREMIESRDMPTFSLNTSMMASSDDRFIDLSHKRSCRKLSNFSATSKPSKSSLTVPTVCKIEIDTVTADGNGW